MFVLSWGVAIHREYRRHPQATGGAAWSPLKASKHSFGCLQLFGRLLCSAVSIRMFADVRSLLGGRHPPRVQATSASYRWGSMEPQLKASRHSAGCLQPFGRLLCSAVSIRMFADVRSLLGGRRSTREYRRHPQATGGAAWSPLKASRHSAGCLQPFGRLLCSAVSMRMFADVRESPGGRSPPRVQATSARYRSRGI
jgi:hypothetical protein